MASPYILTVCAVGGAIARKFFMQKGLGEYKGVFMVTIFEGSHITAACLPGCIVMDEMASIPWWRYITYWLSVCLIICGLLVTKLNCLKHLKIHREILRDCCCW